MRGHKSFFQVLGEDEMEQIYYAREPKKGSLVNWKNESYKCDDILEDYDKNITIFYLRKLKNYL